MILILVPLVALTVPADAPRTTGYIEAQCGGGHSLRNDRVVVGTDGTIRRTSLIAAPIGRRNAASSGQGDAAAVKALWRRLDAIKFDTIASPPKGAAVPDGTNCSLARAGGDLPAHTVSISQRAAMELRVTRWGPKRKPSPALQEVQAVIGAVMAMGGKVSLNPQPIPPKEPIR